MKRIYISIVLALAATAATAQTTTDESTNSYLDRVALWSNQTNAAGLARDTMTDRGVSRISFTHSEGSHHRVQEGNRTNRLDFFTERYQKISPLLYGYGSFHFDNGREFNRSWSDIMRPYNSNPYYTGSAISGNYEFQNFRFTAALATRPIGRLTYGARLDYAVGDLSRLRDPRSRSQLADYRIAPSITYQAGSSTLGLAAHYRRRKEKIPGVAMVQSDAGMVYYFLTGLEHANGIIGGQSSYTRQFTNYEFGGQLSWASRAHRYHQITTFRLSSARENVLGANKYSPGMTHTKTLGLGTRHRIYTPGRLHTIDFDIDYLALTADQYRQERVTTTDSTTGISSTSWNTQIEYKERYRVETLDARLAYRLVWADHAAAREKAHAGITATYSFVQNEYRLPSSTFRHANLSLTALGAYRIALAPHRTLRLDATAGWHKSLSTKLHLSDPTTALATAVLLPDYAYYTTSHTRGTLKATYEFPLRLRNLHRHWFVTTTLDHLRTTTHRHTTAVTIGVGLYH